MNCLEYFVCPICKESFYKQDNTLRCNKGHSFDFASSGYINLLNPGKKNNFKAGDSKEMIKARTSFFSSGAYAKIANQICKYILELNPRLVIDAGCGEGYYSSAMAKCNTSPTVIGFDMSKFGCEHGAKVAKRENLVNLHFSVGNIFDLPIKDNCADLIINMFAPVANEEFKRLLKKGGCFIVASSGIDHLDGLKSAIYDTVHKNEEKFLNYDGFDLIRCDNLKYTTTITGNDTIKNLFTMTPYFHRTSLEDKKKLDTVDEITTTIEVNFAIYKKKD